MSASVKKSRLAPERVDTEEAFKPKPQPKPKYKKITAEQFCCKYRIEENCDSVSKIDGPKHIMNIVDGTNQVLRVLTFE